MVRSPLIAALGIAALIVMPMAPASLAGSRTECGAGCLRPDVVPVKAGAAEELTAKLRLYIGFCQRAKAVYRVDCLAERFAAAGAAMDPYGGLPEVQAALMAASERMAAVAGKYQSGTTAAVVLQGTGAEGFSTSRPILPVAPANLAASNKAALAVLQDAQLTLLRSADKSGNDALAFQEVAAVLDGAKVLLRSS